MTTYLNFSFDMRQSVTVSGSFDLDDPDIERLLRKRGWLRPEQTPADLDVEEVDIERLIEMLHEAGAYYESVDSDPWDEEIGDYFDIELERL